MNAKTETRRTPNGAGTCSDSNSLSEELEYLWDERDAAGKAYEIYLGKISRSPIVRSKLSGRYFLLPWSQILALAARAKVDL